MLIPSHPVCDDFRRRGMRNTPCTNTDKEGARKRLKEVQNEFRHAKQASPEPPTPLGRKILPLIAYPSRQAFATRRRPTHKAAEPPRPPQGAAKPRHPTSAWEATAAGATPSQPRLAAKQNDIKDTLLCYLTIDQVWAPMGGPCFALFSAHNTNETSPPLQFLRQRHLRHLRLLLARPTLKNKGRRSAGASLRKQGSANGATNQPNHPTATREPAPQPPNRPARHPASQQTDRAPPQPEAGPYSSVTSAHPD